MKKRLDVIVAERGLAESREQAQRLIRAGLIYTDGEKLDKPGRSVEEDITLYRKGNEHPFVSRGGLKLAGALDQFEVNPSGRVAVDLGASTGGFTDCLLQRGARLVHAIDVGRGQLHRRLQLDERVLSRERTHMDALEPGMLIPPPDLATADLSFISLRRAFPVLKKILPVNGESILLVKPQFEVGKDRLPHGGVVTDSAMQQEVLGELAQAAEEAGLEVRGRCESPIQGGDGNREFFLYCALSGE